MCGYIVSNGRLLLSDDLKKCMADRGYDKNLPRELEEDQKLVRLGSLQAEL
jgi:hypothetical protein